LTGNLSCLPLVAISAKERAVVNSRPILAHLSLWYINKVHTSIVSIALLRGVRNKMAADESWTCQTVVRLKMQILIWRWLKLVLSGYVNKPWRRTIVQSCGTY